MERVFFRIDEELARHAKENMSFDDYVKGSKTALYRKYVEDVYDLAEKVAAARPDYAARAERMAVHYAERLAENMNKESRINCMCPSILIAGGSNFPVKKKERQNKAADRCYAERQDIEKTKARLTAMLNSKEVIRSDDERAIDLLTDKIQGLKDLQEHMKKVNAYYRKNKTLDNCPHCSEAEIEKLKGVMQSGWHLEDKPFATYTLSNNNANIKRCEQRLKELEAEKERAAAAATEATDNAENQCEYFDTVENTEIMRLQLFFDDKPSEDIRNMLKRNGFHWSNHYKCWQRLLNENARRARRRIIEMIQEGENKG